MVVTMNNFVMSFPWFDYTHALTSAEVDW